jgi:hypothetical protein
LPLSRGGNSKRVKKCTEKNFKIFFSRTSRPKLIKLGTNYLWMIKGQVLFKGGDNHKNIKMGLGHLEIFLFRTMKPEKLNFT